MIYGVEERGSIYYGESMEFETPEQAAGYLQGLSSARIHGLSIIRDKHTFSLKMIGLAFICVIIFKTCTNRELNNI